MIALIPAMAAREVVVAALGTVYALSAVDEDAISEGLAALISGGGELGWSLATGLALLVWFIYAPHCLAITLIWVVFAVNFLERSGKDVRSTSMLPSGSILQRL